MPSTSPRTNCGSRMSPVTISSRSRQLTSSSQPQLLNELYCARARTCAPFPTSISTRCEPMNPSAPVTRTRFPIMMVHYLLAPAPAPSYCRLRRRALTRYDSDMVDADFAFAGETSFQCLRGEAGSEGMLSAAQFPRPQSYEARSRQCEVGHLGDKCTAPG